MCENFYGLILILEEGASKLDVIEGSGHRLTALRIDVRFHTVGTVVGHVLGQVLKTKK